MRILIAILLSVGVFYFADAPESVSLSNSIAAVDHSIMLDVPVCLGNHDIRLGQMPEQLSAQNIRMEAIEDEENILKLQWKINDEVTATDTLVTCTFQNRRLVAVEALSKVAEGTENKHEMIEQIKPLISCINEVQSILEYGKNLSYIEEELGVRQEIELIRDNNVFTGIRYSIGYAAAMSAS